MYSISKYFNQFDSLDFENCDNDHKVLKRILNDFNKSLIEQIDNSDNREHQIHTALEEISYYSGSLSFMFLQNLSATAYLNKLAKESLCKLEEVRYNCGIAFAHLRISKTFVKGLDNGENIILTGNLPWASGYMIFDYLLIGYHFNNQEYISWCKFENSKSFQISDVMQTFVASSLNTVSIKLDNFVISKSNTISIENIGTFNNLLGDSSRMPSLITGIMKRGIDLISDKYVVEKDNFSVQLMSIIENILNKNEIINTRKESLKLSQMIITFCAVSTGGKSVLINNSIQRLYRECLLFSLSGVSPNILESYSIDSINYKSSF